MERNIQKNGLINFVILLLSGVASLIVSRHTNTLAGEVSCAFLGLGVLIAGVSWFQMRLVEQERLEKLEFDELTKPDEHSRLFNTQEAEAFPARRSRELFEKYFVRGFSILLCLLQGFAAWWVWRGLQGAAAQPLNKPLMAMALLGMFALVLFLIGKFSSGLALLEKQRLLRPASNFLLLGAYLLALTIGGIILAQAGFPEADLILARAFGVLLGLLSVESFLGLLLEIYRPRIKGREGLLLYDSRLVGLISHPEGLFTTAAHALDYQFGFKVSETWFYQFLQRAFAWMVLIQLGLLLLSTCFVFVDAGEEALLERFGKPVANREVLPPGLHFKWPWPAEKVQRFRTEEIQQFVIGYEHDEEEEAGAEEKALLWTVTHYDKEFHMLVASRSEVVSTNTAAGKKNPPVNLLSLSVPVQYQIHDLPAWAYHHEDSAALLEDLATREVGFYLASADMQELMSIGRFPAAEELRRRIQAQADEFQLGAKILFVGLQDIHPPVPVAATYERVVAARQEKEASILSAQAFQLRTNAQARSDALRIEREAMAERRRLEVTAHARAALFTNQIPAYQASPSVYAQRLYLETLSRGAQDSRKYILATTNSQDVILLDLQDKIGASLLNVPVPAPRTK